MLPLTTQAIVDIELRFRSGAVDDPPGKAGLTVLTARVMAEGGTQALDAKSLLNALFPLAADLGVRVDKEQTTVIARVHRDNLAKFLPIVTRATQRVALADKYNALAAKAAGFGLLNPDEANVQHYVTGKALDGLYLMIGEEEKKIRRDPIGTGSAILRRVFGG